MKNKASAYDKERLNHINNLMDNIHDCTAEIYESLVDREFEDLKGQIPNLISQLKEIQTSIEDDI
jgi:hypothetical protein|tara:strand:+ start:671 stop:865 length:195 start_codon:yes stop_codon:yes gene_type:complete